MEKPFLLLRPEPEIGTAAARPAHVEEQAADAAGFHRLRQEVGRETGVEGAGAPALHVVIARDGVHRHGQGQAMRQRVLVGAAIVRNVAWRVHEVERLAERRQLGDNCREVARVVRAGEVEVADVGVDQHVFARHGWDPHASNGRRRSPASPVSGISAAKKHSAVSAAAARNRNPAG